MPFEALAAPRLAQIEPLPLTQVKAALVFELITSVQLGGAENVAFTLAQHCRTGASAQRRIVIVELFRTRSAYAKAKRAELEAAGIRIVTLSLLSKRWSLLVAPFALWWRFWLEKPALVHSHTDLPDLALATAVRLARWFGMRLPPLLRTIHNVKLWHTHARLGRYTESAFEADHVIAVSDAALTAYVQTRQRFGLTAVSDRGTIYNGCPSPSRKSLPFPLNKRRANIVFCGRLDLQKGVDVLALVVRAVQSGHPGLFAFHIFGAGPLQSDMARLAAETEGVQLHPPIAGIADFLHVFDFMIMPSRFEGLPLVAIESALAGVPVIAAKAPGLDEALPDTWPLTFDLKDLGAATAVFAAIAAGTLDRDALAAQAQAHARRMFSLHGMVRRYDAVFTRLTAATAAA